MPFNRSMFIFLPMVALFARATMEVASATPVLIDEYAHLPAGISYWQTGRFALYRENPPLIRLLAAFPVWLSDPKMDYRRAGGERSEWNVGLDFLKANGPRVGRLYARARMAIVALAAACGCVVFWWSGKLHGYIPAIVSSSLWFCDPTVIAFSSVVTSDIGATCIGLVATYLFWRCNHSPARSRILLSGAGLGMAIASKFTLLMLIPSWIAIAFLDHHDHSSSDGPPRRSLPRQLAPIFLVTLVTVNTCYLFRGSFTPLGSYRFKSQLLTSLPSVGANASSMGNRFQGTIASGVPVPLPKDFVMGLDSQHWEEEIGLKNLRGGRLVRGGTWNDPLVTLGCKQLPGTLTLLLASAIFLPGSMRYSGGSWMYSLAPPISILCLLCSQTGMNWAARYSLPIAPFLYIIVGSFVRRAWRMKLGKLFVVACVCWNAVEIAHAHPLHLSYANFVAGGPEGAQKRFLGSNFDWGQDLLRLKGWQDRHPAGKPLMITYYGVIKPESVGLDYAGIPAGIYDDGLSGEPSEKSDAPLDCFYWAISSNVLNGLPSRIVLANGAQFYGTVSSSVLKPSNAIDRVGHSIFIFKIVKTKTESQGEKAIRFADILGCTKQFTPDPRSLDATP